MKTQKSKQKIQNLAQSNLRNSLKPINFWEPKKPKVTNIYSNPLP